MREGEEGLGTCHIKKINDYFPRFMILEEFSSLHELPEYFYIEMRPVYSIQFYHFQIFCLVGYDAT
jgi:hypothetical protein